jgi:hypothetical protein
MNPRTNISGLRLKTRVRAGGIATNHNETTTSGLR